MSAKPVAASFATRGRSSRARWWPAI